MSRKYKLLRGVRDWRDLPVALTGPRRGSASNTGDEIEKGAHGSKGTGSRMGGGECLLDEGQKKFEAKDHIEGWNQWPHGDRMAGGIHFVRQETSAKGAGRYKDDTN